MLEAGDVLKDKIGLGEVLGWVSQAEGTPVLRPGIDCTLVGKGTFHDLIWAE